jgi:hypothetical protein
MFYVSINQTATIIGIDIDSHVETHEQHGKSN